MAMLVSHILTLFRTALSEGRQLNLELSGSFTWANKFGKGLQEHSRRYSVKNRDIKPWGGGHFYASLSWTRISLRRMVGFRRSACHRGAQQGSASRMQRHEGYPKEGCRAIG
jgi:hypothetical protein